MKACPPNTPCGRCRNGLREPGGSPAFSLVEISLALGIIAFALLAVFGLLPVAIDSSRDSAKDSTFAAITERVVSDIRSRGYDWLTNSSSSPAKSTVWPYVFDADGRPINETNAAVAINDASRAFLCNVIQGANVNPNALAVTTNAPGGGNFSVTRVEFALEFRYPAAAPAASQDVRRVPMIVSPYE